MPLKQKHPQLSASDNEGHVTAKPESTCTTLKTGILSVMLAASGTSASCERNCYLHAVMHLHQDDLETQNLRSLRGGSSCKSAALVMPLA